VHAREEDARNSLASLDFTLSVRTLRQLHPFCVMPTIRDLVAAIRQREGVEAAVVLGRDGLLIDGQALTGLDVEHVAAHVPSIITAAEDFAKTAGRGELVTSVLEYRGGLGIVSVLSAEAVLLVLVQPNANIGQLLFELRRNREHIAALV
jgi:predicted regulator of Ras-like GTPase activity (Roadblock/LC7/MglB family)